MPIGHIDRTPPPFFRQGPSALTKLILCSALALFLMVADDRLELTRQLRAMLATALYYPQQVLLVPVNAVEGAGGYLMGLQRALTQEEAARRAMARQAARSLQVEQLLDENAHLRKLLDLRDKLEAKTQTAQVLYEAADPYSRKVIIDRGLSIGHCAGIAGGERERRGRAGHARLCTLERGHIDHRQGRGDSGAQHPHSGTRRGLWQCGFWWQWHGDAVHGGQC